MASRKKFSDSPDPFDTAMKNLETVGDQAVERSRKERRDADAKRKKKLKMQQQGGKFYDLKNLTTAE